MTETGARDELGAVEPSAAEVAEAALAHPAVVRLHGGFYGEVGTYLPGRRISGVRVTAERVEVHLVVAAGVPVHVVAAEVRDAVRPVAGGRPVDIVVADLAETVGDSAECTAHGTTAVAEAGQP